MNRLSFISILCCAWTNFASNDNHPVNRYERQEKLQWPQGTYGLMKWARSCPLAGVTWSQGWLKQTTELSSSYNNYYTNHFSPEITEFLAGEFSSNFIRTEYCIKENASEGTGYWPSGTYCILKYGDCPKGFLAGWLKWDDEDDSNVNQHSGVLPDGNYTDDTQIFYCCRDDAAGIDISLPKDHPFVLMRYGKHCQNVEGMEFRDIFIHWNDEDRNNGNDNSDPHPYDANPHKHLLHFCVYTLDGTLFG